MTNRHPDRGTALLFVLSLACAEVGAHHAITAVYDFSRDAKVEGEVVEFQFINPHPFLFIDVKAASGRAERWRLEMDNRAELVGIGMSADSLRPGEVVVVSGSLGRTDPRSLYVRRLDRPSDGFWYEQIGSSPRIRR